MLNNTADPRDVVTVETEYLVITDLEEFVSYQFTVSIATSVGATPSDERSCIQTDPAGTRLN